MRIPNIIILNKILYRLSQLKIQLDQDELDILEWSAADKTALG